MKTNSPKISEENGKETMNSRIDFRLTILIVALLVLGLAACTPAAQAPEAEAPEAEAPDAEATAAPEGGEATAAESSGEEEAMGAIVFDATDACAIFTQEQVAAAFGKNVVEVNPNTQTIGTGCEYKFDPESDTELQVSFYEGDQAKHYLAGLVQASQESCDAFFEKLFDIAFGDAPDSGQDVSGLSMGDLYRQYLGIFENCPSYVNVTDRTDVGENVLTVELIVFNWSSSVAVLGDDRVVEFTYQEPISAEAQADFQTATDRDSYYAAAQPYADSILVGYTETLIGLLHEATMQ
jgi:hypothetical protein